MTKKPLTWEEIRTTICDLIEGQYKPGRNYTADQGQLRYLAELLDSHVYSVWTACEDLGIDVLEN